MHDLDAAKNDARAAEVLEPEHPSDDAFDGPMVLLNYVEQIFDLTNLDGCVAPAVHRVQRGQTGSAFVHRHRLGYAVVQDLFFEITPGASLVPASSQKKVDRVTLLVHGPVKGPPFTPDLHVGFVHPSALPNCSLAAAKRFLKHG